MNDSSNRLAGLKARPKGDSTATLREVDAVAERAGFVDRAPRKKPGRKPSARTFQLHPKVFPEIGEAFALEAERLGLTQGQFLELVWKTYLDHA